MTERRDHDYDKVIADADLDPRTTINFILPLGQTLATKLAPGLVALEPSVSAANWLGWSMRKMIPTADHYVEA